MEIFLMTSFSDDSINIKSNGTTKKSLKVTTEQPLRQATSVACKITEKDSIIVITDVIRGNTISIRYLQEKKYVYVYYHDGKFDFNCSESPLLLE